MLDPVKICDRIIEYSFYLLFFLAPLVFTPWNYELFEFNKMVLVYILTTIIVGAWLVKMALQRRIIFKHSFWDIPLVSFWLGQLLSTLFSIDKYTSVWGYYSRFNGGLISTSCYLLLYWALVANFNRQKALNSLLVLLTNALIVSLYGIGEHFGHSLSCLIITGKFNVTCWVQDVQNRVFATMGQPNWLAAYLLILIPLGIAFFLKSAGKKQKIVFLILSLIFYVCLIYTRSRSGLLSFAVSYLALWGLIFVKQRSFFSWRQFFFLSLTFLTVSFLVGIPGMVSLSRFWQKKNPNPTAESSTPPAFPDASPISESGDIRRVVWQGAVEIWRHYSLLGTGPETFAYSYYWYRPREHNDLSEWDFLYNKAHNEYLNFLATTGTLGFLTYLILIGSYLWWALIKAKVNPLNWALFAGFLSILITNFFGFSVVVISFLFFLIPALEVVLDQEKESKASKIVKKFTFKKAQSIAGTSIILFSLYGLLTISRYWYADTLFSKGEKANKSNQYNLGFKLLEQAISYSPQVPNYRDEIAFSAANLAALAQNQKNTELANQLTEVAISQSNFAMNSSPYNLNFWKNRIKVFYKLAEIEPKYYEQTLAALLRTSELAPTEPKIKYNLGLIYATLNQPEAAIKTMEETIVLKPNYEDAHYALALFYEQAGEKEKAREQLKYILEILNPESQRAKDKIKEL